MKGEIARFGIPDELITDNGPQFSSAEFAQFMQEYDIKHTTTSPYHPQANGQAERMVQTVKHLLKKAKDPYIALLHYRNTQLDTGKSPAELFLGRKLKTTLPARTKTLKHAKHSKKHHKQMTERQNKQKHYFDRKASNTLSSFKPGDPVMMKFGDTWKKAEIVKPHSTPRSYIVRDEQNVQYRRNRILLRPTHVQSKPNDSDRLKTQTDGMKEKGMNGHVPKEKNGNCPEAKEKNVKESGTKEKGTKENSSKEKKVVESDKIPVTSEKTFEKSDTVVKTRSGRIINPPKKFSDEYT